MTSIEPPRATENASPSGEGPASKVKSISYWIDGLIELAFGYLKTFVLLFLQRRALFPSMTSPNTTVLLPHMTVLVLSALLFYASVGTGINYFTEGLVGASVEPTGQHW